MQAFILRKKAFQISYVLRDMPEYKPIPKYFFSIIQAPLELKGSFPNDLSADCQPTDCWPQLAISLHEWFLYTYGGAALIKCFVPNAGLMHGSTWPATTSPHPPPTTPKTSPALWAQGWGIVWSSPVPGVWGWGKSKITFLWFCKLCVISCAVCMKLQNSRPHSCISREKAEEWSERNKLSRLKSVCGWRRPKQTNGKRNFEGCVAAG